MSENRSYTFDEFKEMIIAEFGNDIVFTSCSDNIFDISEVPSFLLSREKIVIEDDMIKPHPALTACDH